MRTSLTERQRKKPTTKAKKEEDFLASTVFVVFTHYKKCYYDIIGAHITRLISLYNCVHSSFFSSSIRAVFHSSSFVGFWLRKNL